MCQDEGNWINRMARTRRATEETRPAMSYRDFSLEVFKEDSRSDVPVLSSAGVQSIILAEDITAQIASRLTFRRTRMVVTCMAASPLS